MNNNRRIEFKKALGLLLNGKTMVERVKNEEEFAFDNLSEGLQQTLRGATMEENIDVMDEIIEKLQEVIDLFDEVQ